MTELEVRRPAFRIDDSVPFPWQPARPGARRDGRPPGPLPAARPRPRSRAQPAWVDEWHAAYRSGADISTYAGARL